jgi:hypothetical protein
LKDALARFLVKRLKAIEPVRIAYDYDRDIESMIHALENYHTNPEGVYWIGQTLVQCHSFLNRYAIAGRARELVQILLDDIDNDERSKMGAFDVLVSPKKIADLITELKEVQKRVTKPTADLARGQRSTGAS